MSGLMIAAAAADFVLGCVAGYVAALVCEPHAGRHIVPAREVAESAGGLGSLERTPAAGAAPAISEAGAVRDCCYSPADEDWHWASCPTVRDDEPDEDGLGRYRPPMSPDPAQVPFTGWQVPDDWQPVQVLPGGRGLMRTGCETWLTAGQPVAPDPVPGPPVSPARPYVLANGPAGCEET